MPRGVYVRTEEHRRINSEAQTGVKRRPQTDEHKRKIGAGNRGKKRTEEQRKINSEAQKKAWTEERRQEWADAQRGRDKYGNTAAGFYIHHGYRYLTMQQGHPLAQPTGLLQEHRKVLYDAIGPGPHPCHWGCGRMLEWGGYGGVQPDHLDGDKLNNETTNLVPSCISCNARRAKAGNPIDWDG